MQFSATDINAMLAALGEPALLRDTATTLRVQFHAPGALVEMFGQMVVSEHATALCSEAAAAALDITGGDPNTATQLTIRGNDYRVISLVPDGIGFARLTLEKLT